MFLPYNNQLTRSLCYRCQLLCHSHTQLSFIRWLPARPPDFITLFPVHFLVLFGLPLIYVKRDM